MIYLWIGLGIFAVSVLVFVVILLWEVYTKDERFDTPQERFRLRAAMVSVFTSLCGGLIVIFELLRLFLGLFFH